MTAASMRRSGWLAALLAGAACVGPGTPGPAPGPPWRAPSGHEHVLAGQIWDVQGGRSLSPEEFVRRTLTSRFLLLGEKHDNPDHHLIQAWIIRALVAAGRRPVVAFEMFSPDQLPALERHLASHPRDAIGLAEAVGWGERSWPAFALYQPLVEAVLTAGLVLRPANLSRAELEALRRNGMSSLDQSFVERFGLNQSPPEDQYRSLVAEIQKAHCGYAPQTALGGMIDVQRARDARMAAVLGEAAGIDGAVLIAGAGHARSDRGVPAYLLLEEPDAKILSLGLIEVAAGVNTSIEHLETDAGPFDYVWFTPRVDDLDPCEKFRDQLEQLRKGRSLSSLARGIYIPGRIW